MAEPKTLYYDGHCGLCHGAVRFILRHDPSGPLKFAPLQGETFLEEVPPDVREVLPDSLVLVANNGEVLTRSSSVVALLLYLGGGWAVWGKLLGCLPSVLRDGAYRVVAAVRHRLFRRPEALCPLLPPDLRSRFLP